MKKSLNTGPICKNGDNFCLFWFQVFKKISVKSQADNSANGTQTSVATHRKEYTHCKINKEKSVKNNNHTSSNNKP